MSRRSSDRLVSLIPDDAFFQLRYLFYQVIDAKLPRPQKIRVKKWMKDILESLEANEATHEGFKDFRNAIMTTTSGIREISDVVPFDTEEKAYFDAVFQYIADISTIISTELLRRDIGGWIGR
jgi:hypothetical protein